MNNNIDSDFSDKSHNKLLPVSASGKYSIIIFFVAILLIIGLTFLTWAIRLTNSYAARMCLTMLVIVAYTAVAVVAMFLTGQQKALLPTKRRLWL